jgi:hypothetical protein
MMHPFGETTFCKNAYIRLLKEGKPPSGCCGSIGIDAGILAKSTINELALGHTTGFRYGSFVVLTFTPKHFT